MLIVLGVVIAFWWLGRPDRSAVSRGQERSLDELWTGAESSRLAGWSLARTGILSAGPPPVRLRSPAPRVTGEPSPAERAAQSFNTVSATLRTVHANAGGTNAAAVPHLDPVRVRQLLARLEQAETGLPRSEAAAIGYQRALVYFWSDGLSPANRTLGAAGCSGDAPPAAVSRQGLRVACLWLKGRLREAAESGSGAPDLAAAVNAALALRRPSEAGMIFLMRAEVHLVDADVGDLWQDYLASLLAQRVSKPIVAGRDEAVLELARDPTALDQRAELAAMLKMLLARQGQFGLMRKFAALREGASEAARRLSETADVVAQNSGTNGAPALSDADAAELGNWIAHNCHRSQQLGASGACTEVTPEFAEWEADWHAEFKDKLQGRNGLAAKLIRWVVWLFVGLFVAAAIWFIAATALLGSRREALYRSKFRAAHFEQSSGRAAVTRKKATLATADD